MDNVYTRPVVTGTRSGCPVTGMGARFDPFDPEYLTQPYLFFDEARSNEPVFYSPLIDHWVVTRHDDVRRVLLDGTNFSAKMVQSPITPWPQDAIDAINAMELSLAPNLSNNDAPAHTAIRKFVADQFTPKALAPLEPDIRRICAEVVSRVRDAGSGDLVMGVFREVPPRVLCLFIGMPDSDVDRLKRWSESRTLLTWGRPDAEQVRRSVPSFIENVRYCYELVAERTRRPRSDFISRLIRRFDEERPDGVARENIALTLFGLMMAGHDTTTNQAANTVRAILSTPGAAETLLQTPSALEAAVEEGIRYDPTIIAWRRLTKTSVKVGEMEIPAKSQVLLVLGSANRDESKFADARSFQIDRENVHEHLGFGAGAHYCLGASLARLELRNIIGELFRQLPSLRLAPAQSYSYVPNTSIRGPQSLLAEWDALGIEKW